MAIAGLDIGSSGVKCAIYDRLGILCASAYQEYDLICPAPGKYELNPTDIQNAAFFVLKAAVQQYGKQDITAICATSFGETFTLLDENRQPLINGMLYIDQRGSEQVQQFNDALGRAQIIRTCGADPHAMYSACKLKYFVQTQPELMKKARYLCFMADYVLFCLGAAHCTDYSLAARSLCLDVMGRCYHPQMLQEVGLDESVYPKLVPTGSVIGRMDESLAAQLGLRKDVALVICGHDQIPNAIGAGVLESGSAVNSIGTVDCITPAFALQRVNEEMAKNSYACVPYLISDCFVTYAFHVTGGSGLKWYRDKLAPDIAKHARAHGQDPYDRFTQTMPDTCGDLLVLPHFAGCGTPYMDTASTAALIHMDLNTSREDIFCALLEGEAFEMKLNIGLLAQYGVPIERLKTVGGGSKNDRWLQLRADIFQIPVIRMKYTEAGALGCVMLGAVATGAFPDLQAARDALVTEEKVFLPRTDNLAYYERKFATYKALYTALKTI